MVRTTMLAPMGATNFHKTSIAQRKATTIKQTKAEQKHIKQGKRQSNTRPSLGRFESPHIFGCHHQCTIVAHVSVQHAGLSSCMLVIAVLELPV